MDADIDIKETTNERSGSMTKTEILEFRLTPTLVGVDKCFLSVHVEKGNDPNFPAGQRHMNECRAAGAPQSRRNQVEFVPVLRKSRHEPREVSKSRSLVFHHGISQKIWRLHPLPKLARLLIVVATKVGPAKVSDREICR